MGGLTPVSDNAPAERQRLDKWLFFARLAKSRSLAQGWIAAGHVRLNGSAMRQAAHTVRPGDRIEIFVERRHIVVVVLAQGLRRGPSEEARLLYEDHSPVVEREKISAYDLATREPGAGRPTKKQRRATDRLLDLSRD